METECRDYIVQQRLIDLIKRLDPSMSKLIESIIECYDQRIQSIILESRDKYHS